MPSAPMTRTHSAPRPARSTCRRPSCVALLALLVTSVVPSPSSTAVAAECGHAPSPPTDARSGCTPHLPLRGLGVSVVNFDEFATESQRTRSGKSFGTPGEDGDHTERFTRDDEDSTEKRPGQPRTEAAGRENGHAPLARPATPDAKSTPAPDLDLLRAELERFRVNHGIEGLAAAIVTAEEELLVAGFGTRGAVVAPADAAPGDASDQRAASFAPGAITPTTRFALGAAGVPMVSTLLAILVDAGVLHWNDRVTKSFPRFRLASGGTTCTLRDLLLERTGLMPMPVVWMGGVDLQTALEPLGRAKPTSPFGVRWQENALGVAMAAHAAARAAQRGDVPPDGAGQLLAARLFEPLGMTRSTTDLESVLTDGDRALGHTAVREERSSVVPQARPAVAASLGTWSSAADLARWLRFQLERGRLDGRRLVSRERLEETWMPQAPLVVDEGAAAPYLPGAAMGWLAIGTREDRMLLREGSIDGFTSLVALLPDRGVGIALLANRADVPLSRAAIEVVLEAMAGRSVDAGRARDVRSITGLYRSDLLQNEVRVFEHRGTLLLQATNQPALELRPPGRDGRHRIHGSLTSFVEFRFATDDSDGETSQAQWLRFDEMGLVLELPRIGATFEPEIGADEAALLSGRYHDPRVGHPVEIASSPEGRLQMRVPGQTSFDLRRGADDASDGSWHLALTPQTVLRFNRTADGRATSITMLQGSTTIELPRLGDLDPATPSPLPAALARLAASTRDLLDHGGVKRAGTISFPDQGVTGTIAIAIEGDAEAPRLTQSIEFAPFGFSRLTLDRDGGERMSPSGGVELVDARDRSAAWLAALTPIAPIVFVANGGDAADASRTHGLVIVDLDALRATPPGVPGAAPNAAQGAETGEPPPTPTPAPLLHRGLIRLADGTEAVISIGMDDGLIHRIETRAALFFDVEEQLDIRFEEYEHVGDIHLPRRVVVESLWFGRLVVEFEPADAAGE